MSEWYLVGVLLGSCLSGTPGVEQADNGEKFATVESIGCERMTIIHSKHPSRGTCLVRREELFDIVMKFNAESGLYCVEIKGE